ncbi:MAG: glycosyltransferase family 2 protein [Lachnospiraceae bacterium]|nr:glycosyltransferase family 2 protein [Lachnospiraceae bacterium]
MKEIRLSIIIPAYNAENTILKCISSVVQIDFAEWEVWIIDDGSNDNTYEVCMNGIQDERIHVVRQENQGVSATRNKGMRLAQGEYIIFVDADDTIDIKNLSENLREMDLNKSDLGFFALEYVNGVDQSIKCIAPPDKYVGTQKDFLQKFLINFMDTALLCGPVNKIFRRNIIIDNDICFNEMMNLYEDILFVFTYLQYVSMISFHSDMVYYYHHDTSGLSGKYNEQSFFCLHVLYNNLKKCIVEWNLSREQERYIYFYVAALLIGSVKKIATNSNFSMKEKKEKIDNSLQQFHWRDEMKIWHVRRIKTAVAIMLLRCKCYGLLVKLCTIIG